MHFYSHNIGDFAAVTSGLDFEEVGIFVRLLDRYVSTEKPIKTQWVNLGFKNDARDKAQAILEGLFEETDDGYVYEPAMKWIADYQKNAEKNRENGKKGGRPKKNAVDENPSKPSGLISQTQNNPLERQPRTINQELLTNNQVLIKEKSAKKKLVLEKPEGVSPQVWSDFVALRKQKKAPLTETALKGIAREAQKAGITLEDALSTCCQRGWQGFNSEWILGNATGKANGYAPKVTTGPKTLEPDWSQIDYGEGGFL